MSVVRRGASYYASSVSSPTHNVPLPTGSAVGDWIIMCVDSQAFSMTITMPGTEVFNSANNTMSYALSTKQLTATDVQNGYLPVTLSNNYNMAAIIIGYSSAGGFAAPGTVWTKNGTSMNYVTTPATTSNGAQDILVFAAIKHSGNPQTLTGTSPAITQLAATWQNGSGQMGMYAGVYTGATQNVTVSWGVSSGNGAGFQVAVLDAATNVETLGVWNGSVTPIEILGSWDGDSVVPVEIIR